VSDTFSLLSGMATQIEPLPNEPSTGGFSDVGDVSYITPTMGITVPTIPKGIALHSWQATASHGTGIGFKAADTAAKVLALTGVDPFTDAEFLKQVKADFDKRTEGFTYKSPIPAMIKEPSGLPDSIRSFGTRLEMKQSIINSTGDHSLGPHSHGLGDSHNH
jgi:aminobenzoyl-glutamate utilization protein B